MSFRKKRVVEFTEADFHFHFRALGESIDQEGTEEFITFVEAGKYKTSSFCQTSSGEYPVAKEMEAYTYENTRDVKALVVEEECAIESRKGEGAILYPFKKGFDFSSFSHPLDACLVGKR